MTKRPFRFGTQHQGTTLEEWQTFVRKAEDIGFSTVHMQDHFMPQLAPLPALMYAASVTSRVRLGTLVLDNDFRHPAVLAKEAASIDVLTGGRFELGLGAGWLVKDYDSTGLPFAPAAERYERLRETLAILKGYFGQAEPLTYEGKHYQVRELDTSPRPVQTPHPPILIGGRQKRMLSFAAREADIISISMLDPRRPDLPKPPTFAEKVSWVRASAGERINDIELHVNASNIEVTDNADDAMARLTQRLQITPEEALLSPANLIGSVDDIIERMHAWREQTGVSYFNIQGRLIDDVAELVAKAVGT